MKTIFATILFILSFVFVCEAQNQCRMYGFFPFNDKYAQNYTADSLHHWLKDFCSNLSTDSVVFDVLAGNGGGPNGSQWNPSSDLIIVLTNTMGVMPLLCRVYLNKRQSKSIVCSSIAGERQMIWFIIPQKVWEKQLRVITKNDINHLFSDSPPNVELSDMQVGEIVEIQVQSLDKRISVKKFFHAAYGE